MKSKKNKVDNTGMERIQIPKEEQETTIVLDPITKSATVYSCVPSMVKKIESMCGEDEVEVISNDKYGIKVRVPYKWIKISKPRKRECTDEQKAILKERLERARAIKNGIQIG